MIWFAIFGLGLFVGWISMLLFICLTGNMRTWSEQEMVISKPLKVFSPPPPPPRSTAPAAQVIVLK